MQKPEIWANQKKASELGTQIRDVKDRPILRAAKIAKVDILLTGDKDFLESGINTPKIVNPSQFLSIT